MDNSSLHTVVTPPLFTSMASVPKGQMCRNLVVYREFRCLKLSHVFFSIETANGHKHFVLSLAIWCIIRTSRFRNRILSTSDTTLYKRLVFVVFIHRFNFCEYLPFFTFFCIFIVLPYRKKVRCLVKYMSLSFGWSFFKWFFSGVGDSCGFDNFPTFGVAAFKNT